MGNFLLKVLYARLVLDDDWIDVDGWSKEGCNLKKVWELVDLMTLWLMIIDEWLGFEGVVLVVAVLLGCLVRMIYVCYPGNFCLSVQS